MLWKDGKGMEGEGVGGGGERLKRNLYKSSRRFSIQEFDGRRSSKAETPNPDFTGYFTPTVG